MKLSNLSLAILSAIALAACGSSGNDNQTTDPGAGSTPPKQITPPKKITPPKDDEKKDDQQNAAKDKEVVNPTEDPVVDNIDLSDTSTTASQQYIRGKKSNYDNQANPSEPASTTVLSGITLDKQNPQLTNIVLARPQGTNKNGDIVQIAQFAGSSSNTMSSIKATDSDNKTLQDLNAPNALVSSESEVFAKFDSSDPKFANWTLRSDSKSFVTSNVGAFINDAIKGSVGVGQITTGTDVLYAPKFEAYLNAKSDYLSALNAFLKDPNGKNESGQKYLDLYKAQLTNFAEVSGGALAKVSSSTKASLNIMNLLQYPKAFSDYKLKPQIDIYNIPKDISNDLPNAATDQEVKEYAEKLKNGVGSIALKVSIQRPSDEVLEQFGYRKYIFTQDGQSFADDKQNVLTQEGWGDVYDSNNKKVVGVPADASLTEGGPTHGLVGIWKQKDGQKDGYFARGTDDNNIRSTRIFGHYYRDPGAFNGELLSEGYNSWGGASTIITGWNASTKKVNQYGLAAEPLKLNNVQYGRVTAQIDDLDFNKEAKTNGWTFRRQSTVARDPEHKDDGVDFYFYRGTNATSVKDMASLPADTKISYQGHALMYGIDNSFHGNGDVLPNAFGVTQSYGLGNFVEATFDVGQNKLSGHIYNAWHSPKSATVVKDNLVDFNGDVIGNTAYGTAELAYDASAPKGIFKGSFFGPKAQELGGSVNSVDNKDVYGSLGWGGVFGAQRVGGKGTGSAWLVSSQTK